MFSVLLTLFNFIVNFIKNNFESIFKLTSDCLIKYNKNKQRKEQIKESKLVETNFSINVGSFINFQKSIIKDTNKDTQKESDNLKK